MDQFGIFRLGLFARFRFGFLSPIGKNLLPEFADLFDGPGFGLVSGAALGKSLIDHIRDQVQSPTQVRAVGEAFIKALMVFTLIVMGQFIIHELFKYTE